MAGETDTFYYWALELLLFVWTRMHLRLETVRALSAVVVQNQYVIIELGICIDSSVEYLGVEKRLEMVKSLFESSCHTPTPPAESVSLWSCDITELPFLFYP